MSPMTLWERSDALAVLEELYRETAQAGGIALVAGEAGIGKSALIRAFADRCGARARVLLGLCDPLVTPRASGPLHDIARQAGGVLAERLDAGSTQSELFGALVEELTGPVQRPRRIVVIEDAHWADEATHDLVVFLGRRIERLPAMLVLTYRDDELGTEHPLRATLAVLPRQVVRTVPLKPLSRECVAEQAANAGRDADDLFERSGGNPLLLTELLAAEDRAVPATVRDLILARLRRLSPPARDLARLVSVMPTSADALILDGMEEPVDECIAAGVLMSFGDGVSFRHELLRHAVEESMSAARRVALHRRALDLLATLDGTDPARLVHHARHAGDVDALLRHGVEAATGAAAQGAHREAVAHFRAIRPHAERLMAADRVQLLEQYAVEAYLAGMSVEALEVRRAALPERERLGDPVRVGESYRWISRMAWWSGRGAEARRAATRAVEVLEGAEPSRELAMAYSNRSQLHMLAHENDEAVEWGARARALADQMGDLETSIHASINVSAARLNGGDQTAVAALRDAHATASAAGLAEHAARALVCVSAAHLLAWEYDACAAVGEEALSYALAHDLDGYIQYLLGVRALIRLERCDWDAALVDAEHAIRLANRIGVAAVFPLVATGRILAARGLPEALSTLDMAADVARGTEELQRIGPVAAARAEYFLLNGDLDRAAAEARTGLSLAMSKGHRWFAAELGFLLWQATGSVDPATELTPYQLLIDGDWERAAQAWADKGLGYARVNALSNGDAAAAAEAIRILADLGAVRATQRVRAELRRRGVSGVPRGPRASTATNAAGLTARQLEVLGLLAEGLTNTDIAARLTLSTKTVEHHVSAVLDKLQVTTRGQAIAAAHRLNLQS